MGVRADDTSMNNKRIAVLVAIVAIWAAAVVAALVLAKAMLPAPAPGGPLTANDAPALTVAPEPEFGTEPEREVSCTQVPEVIINQLVAAAPPDVTGMRGLAAWTVYEPQISDRVYVAMRFTAGTDTDPQVGVWGMDAFRDGADIWPADATAAEYSTVAPKQVSGPLDAGNIADAVQCLATQ